MKKQTAKEKNLGKLKVEENIQNVLKKILSMGLVVCFLSSTVSVVPAVAQETTVLGRQIAFNLDKLKFPLELGKVEDYFKGTDKKTVILIQDAHAVPDAQRNIQKTIDFFQKKQGVRLIGFEGASQEADAHLFKSFPDKEVLKKTFNRYMDNGELTGVTAAAIFNETPSIYYGIENWSTYEEGLSLYLEAMTQKSRLLKKVTTLQNKLQLKKEKIYSAQLLEIDKAVESFHENKSDLASALNQLSKIRKPAKNTELAFLVEDIKKTNNQLLDAEIKNIAQKVKTFLKSEETSDSIPFNESFQQFQTSTVSSSSFAVVLSDLISKYNLKIKVSEDFINLKKRQERLQSIEGAKLFEDFEIYISDVKNTIFRNDVERNLDRETYKINLFKKLTNLELSHKEWNEIKNAEHSLSEDSKTHLSFYKNAERRDKAFFKNLMNLMKAKSRNTAILVAGGFHANGLTEQLKEKGISYLLITPQISYLPEHNGYREQMKGNVSWKNYFEIEKNGKVNLYKAFVRNTRDNILKMSKEEALLKRWRDQIILDLAAEEKISEVGNYTSFIDEIFSTQEKKWVTNANRFIQQLQKLETNGQLTEQNILKLFQPSTVQSSIGAVLTQDSVESFLVGRSRIPQKVFNLSDPKKSKNENNILRSETRIAKLNPDQPLALEKIEREALYLRDDAFWQKVEGANPGTFAKVQKVIGLDPSSLQQGVDFDITEDRYYVIRLEHPVDFEGTIYLEILAKGAAFDSKNHEIFIPTNRTELENRLEFHSDGKGYFEPVIRERMKALSYDDAENEYLVGRDAFKNPNSRVDTLPVMLTRYTKEKGGRDQHEMGVVVMASPRKKMQSPVSKMPSGKVVSYLLEGQNRETHKTWEWRTSEVITVLLELAKSGKIKTSQYHQYMRSIYRLWLEAFKEFHISYTHGNPHFDQIVWDFYLTEQNGIVEPHFSRASIRDLSEAKIKKELSQMQAFGYQMKDLVYMIQVEVLNERAKKDPFRALLLSDAIGHYLKLTDFEKEGIFGKNVWGGERVRISENQIGHIIQELSLVAQNVYTAAQNNQLVNLEFKNKNRYGVQFFDQLTPRFYKIFSETWPDSSNSRSEIRSFLGSVLFPQEKKSFSQKDVREMAEKLAWLFSKSKTMSIVFESNFFIKGLILPIVSFFNPIIESFKVTNEFFTGKPGLKMFAYGILLLWAPFSGVFYLRDLILQRKNKKSFFSWLNKWGIITIESNLEFLLDGYLSRGFAESLGNFESEKSLEQLLLELYEKDKNMPSSLDLDEFQEQRIYQRHQKYMGIQYALLEERLRKKGIVLTYFIPTLIFLRTHLFSKHDLRELSTSENAAKLSLIYKIALVIENSKNFDSDFQSNLKLLYQKAVKELNRKKINEINKLVQVWIKRIQSDRFQDWVKEFRQTTNRSETRMLRREFLTTVAGASLLGEHNFEQNGNRKPLPNRSEMRKTANLLVALFQKGRFPQKIVSRLAIALSFLDAPDEFIQIAKASVIQASRKEDETLVFQSQKWTSALQKPNKLFVEYRISDRDLKQMKNPQEEIRELINTAHSLAIVASVTTRIVVPPQAGSVLKINRFEKDSTDVITTNGSLIVGPHSSEGIKLNQPARIVIANRPDFSAATLLTDQLENGERVYGESPVAAHVLIAALTHAISPDLTAELLVWPTDGQGRITNRPALSRVAGFVQQAIVSARAEMRIQQAA